MKVTQMPTPLPFGARIDGPTCSRCAWVASSPPGPSGRNLGFSVIVPLSWLAASPEPAPFCAMAMRRLPTVPGSRRPGPFLLLTSAGVASPRYTCPADGGGLRRLAGSACMWLTITGRKRAKTPLTFSTRAQTTQTTDDKREEKGARRHDGAREEKISPATSWFAF